MITKKQKKLNKKLRHQQTKAYAIQQSKKERNRLDNEWKEKVKAEFDSKCAYCGANEKPVHCHHLIPREIKQFRHEPLNGIALCPLHHKWSIELSPHRNPLTFYLWYSTHYTERYNKLINMHLELKEVK